MKVFEKFLGGWKCDYDIHENGVYLNTIRVHGPQNVKIQVDRVNVCEKARGNVVFLLSRSFLINEEKCVAKRNIMVSKMLNCLYFVYKCW